MSFFNNCQRGISHFRWYYDKGYITARDGNFAVRCGSNSFLLVDGKSIDTSKDHFFITRSGAEKHCMESEKDIMVVDKDGHAVDENNCKPSIETGAHLAALMQSGKEASVHVHSPNTVALAALFEQRGGFRPQEHHLVEILNSKWPELFRYTKVGHIVPFLEPGSQKLHDSISSSLGYWTEEPVYNLADPEEIVGLKDVKKYNDIAIMQRHGVLAIGNDLDECMEHIVRLEHISGILLKIVTASGDLESIL